jgi:hypothetical protein
LPAADGDCVLTALCALLIDGRSRAFALFYRAAFDLSAVQLSCGRVVVVSCRNRRVVAVVL